MAAAYDEHATHVFRTALVVLGEVAVAEDVTHDVFLDLWRHPGRFDAARGGLGGYLRMVARSRALDAWRRNAAAVRTRERVAREVAVAPAHAEPACAVAEREASAPILREAVGRLPAAQREAITLAYWGGLSATEIAQRRGLPLGTVKSRLRLGLARLARDAETAAAAA